MPEPVFVSDTSWKNRERKKDIQVCASFCFFTHFCFLILTGMGNMRASWQRTQFLLLATSPWLHTMLTAWGSRPLLSVLQRTLGRLCFKTWMRRRKVRAVQQMDKWTGPAIMVVEAVAMATTRMAMAMTRMVGSHWYDQQHVSCILCSCLCCYNLTCVTGPFICMSPVFLRVRRKEQWNRTCIWWCGPEVPTLWCDIIVIMNKH